MVQDSGPSRHSSIKAQLLRVLALSVALSLGVVLTLVHFYGSVQTGRDVLIAPSELAALQFRDIDPKSGKTEVFTIDVTDFLRWEEHDNSNVSPQMVFEPTYRTIYQFLRRDHLKVVAHNKEELRALYTLHVYCKSPKSPFASLELQRIDFLEDRTTYRITGRRDRKESELYWHFTHRDAGKSIAKLIADVRSKRLD